jgi:glucosamine-6-phosphate deaminase
VNCERFSSESALASAVARRIATAIKRSPEIVLGLPTGRTPVALYAELVRITEHEKLDWSRVRTFNLDEFVGMDQLHPGSYRAFMESRLFSHVNIAPAHIEFLKGNAPALEAECARYERAILEAGGLDLVLLGIGLNGHVGFNEPGDSLVARTHVVTLDHPTRMANAQWFGGDIDQVPRQALTMGIGTILRSRAIILIATGEAKEEPVTAMLKGPVTTRVPASFLQLHPRVTVALDESLADGLEACR